jgi:myo-inositol 2-dehydrogenase / D-chiro-inositol 1-dehydrogenase
VGINNSVIRYGIIGTGLMGCEHIRNIAAIPDAVVAAIADPHPISREWARAAMPSGATAPIEFENYLEMISANIVDAVVICTPNFTHARVLNDIFDIAPQLHVMVEKPLCTTIADARRVVERTKTHKGLVWMGLEYRYMPPVAQFLRELTMENIGNLKMISIREHRYPFLIKVGDWNRFTVNTGGTLVEKCCHFFDLMNLAIGARPTRVYASGGQDVNHLNERYPGNPAGEIPDILDNAFVVVDYANGGRGLLDLCMFAEASTNEQELVAVGDRGKVESKVTEGTVVIGRRGPALIDSIGRAGPPTMLAVNASSDNRIEHVGYHHGASYLEHLGFLDAIRDDIAPAVTVEEGLWSIAVGVAGHQSIAEGRPILLSELGLA